MHERITVIDIGSGSMKASVFGCSDNQLQTLSSLSCGIRLCNNIGCNISSRKARLTNGFIEKTIELSEKNQSNKIIAVATQAARMANNFRQLQQQIATRFGIEIVAISGEDEAKLFALTINHTLGIDKFLSFDMGCGSIEFAEFDKKILNAWSLPISPLELRDMNDQSHIESHINELLSKVILDNQSKHVYPVIGNGGILHVAKTLLHRQDEMTLPYDALDKLYHVLIKKSEKEKLAMGVPRTRVDIIQYSILILLKIMQYMDTNEIAVTNGNLRTGLALKYFKRF